MKPLKAPIIILAGGLGTRLGSLTQDQQKCMLPINGRPFLSLLIDHYRSQGFEQFTICTGYFAEQVEAYDFGPGVTFLRDDEHGPSELVYSPFPSKWVLNGDTFIPELLPQVQTPTILICNGVDAGAQFHTFGKIQVHRVLSFMDIGTVEGLQRFEDYHNANRSYAV